MVPLEGSIGKTPLLLPAALEHLRDSHRLVRTRPLFLFIISHNLTSLLFCGNTGPMLSEDNKDLPGIRDEDLKIQRFLFSRHTMDVLTCVLPLFSSSSFFSSAQGRVVGSGLGFSFLL